MPGFPAHNPQPRVMESLSQQLGALHAGTGPEVEIMLDANFHLQLVRAVEPHRLAWLELDIYDPAALALLRREVGFPIASGESLYARRGLSAVPRRLCHGCRHR
ncbi:MAG: enolase [Roseomonas sp.]|nr:enolase [Roseomonas sp.]